MIINFSNPLTLLDSIVFESPPSFGQGTPATPPQFGKVRVISKGGAPPYMAPPPNTVPALALLDGLGNPILDGNNNYILGGS